MITFELITMLGSAILGGIMQLWANKQKDQAEYNKMQLQLLDKQGDMIEAARNVQNTAMQFTRRIIVLSAMFAIIILPPMASLLFPDITITTGYTEFRPGWLFLPDKEVLVWKETTGIVLGPLHTNLVSAITGFYFGSATTKR